MGGELQRPNSHDLAVVEDVVYAGSIESKATEVPGKTGQAQGAISGTSRCDYVGISSAHPQLRARCILEVLQPPGVIGMGMGIQEYLHIPDIEPELGDALFDKGPVLRVASVDQYVTFRTGQQKRRHTRVTHVVQVSSDPERLVGNRPISLDR
jgi:hypothetical protein